MLNEAIVNSSPVGSGAAVYVRALLATSGAGAGSVSIVKERLAYSSGPTRLLTIAPEATSRAALPGWPREFTARTSGLASQRGTQHGEPAGSGSGSCTPASRNGRAIPVITPSKTPLEVEVAFASLRLPRVGPVTVKELTCTRIPS